MFEILKRTLTKRVFSEARMSPIRKVRSGWLVIAGPTDFADKPSVRVAAR